MLDPIFAPPALFIRLIEPIARILNLTTLPLHAHEILLSCLFYQVIYSKVSPYVSARLFPKFYPHFPRRTKLNWDVHVVSFVQSLAINTIALWTLINDAERQHMGWRERVWGYTGAGGMIQALAAGYFLWDLMITARHVDVFGWGMLAHAISALVVFSLGFRPFVNFYGPTFILYELSSPFLNIHWFCDKINLTGSKAQWYNGVLLLLTFFSCRLVWGTYQSVRVYQDVWAALQSPGPEPASSKASNVLEVSDDPFFEVMRFSGPQVVPNWLAITYMGSNIVLNSLNFFWFGKMIETVKKRFEPAEKEAPAKSEGDGVLGKSVETSYAVDTSGRRVLSVEEQKLRRRRESIPDVSEVLDEIHP